MSENINNTQIHKYGDTKILDEINNINRINKMKFVVGGLLFEVWNFRVK